MRGRSKVQGSKLLRHDRNERESSQQGAATRSRRLVGVTAQGTGAPGGSRLPRSKCTRGMARWVWLARWAGHRLELTATSPWIDSCTPVGKTRCRPGKSRSCDGQGRRSRYTTDDARPDLAQTNKPGLDKRKLESVRFDALCIAWKLDQSRRPGQKRSRPQR